MRDLLELVEEAKAALTALRKTIQESKIESVQTMSEFGTSDAEIIEKASARITINEWSTQLTTFVGEDAETGYKTSEKEKFR